MKKKKIAEVMKELINENGINDVDGLNEMLKRMNEMKMQILETGIHLKM